MPEERSGKGLTVYVHQCHDYYMNTTTPTAKETTMNTTTIRNADLADELAAGRSFPIRNALIAQNRTNAVALLQARRAFWLAAAAGYAAQVQAGCADAAADAATALAQAERYAA